MPADDRPRAMRLTCSKASESWHLIDSLEKSIHSFLLPAVASDGRSSSIGWPKPMMRDSEGIDQR